ncbi:hypothetical protein Patl1_13845 [Pistacia atlantica]|uniref:Uncharacterized protein n=1 Tax=Pistacia atlantica TaxID=434234 RepID=A0ACC1AYD2_9ROSI|nr:hypothetical protein Patl1_13845 [Pistacia atlantica]
MNDTTTATTHSIRKRRRKDEKDHRVKSDEFEHDKKSFREDDDGEEGGKKKDLKERRHAFSPLPLPPSLPLLNQIIYKSLSSKEAVGRATAQHRRLWVKDRSKAWWDECNSPDYPEEEFKKWFRMRRQTFDMICEELNSVIAKEDTTLRNAIPVRQRVAVCIWRLATAIRSVLMPKYLQWPDEEGLRKIKEEYEVMSGIPNAVGSMYTTHIPIIAPKISVAAYFNKRHTERNQKTSYSITVLEKSALYQRASGGLLKGVWIVGGSGYPLLDWVLVPYTQQNLTWTQHAFNEKIGEIQRVAKDAFARLKGRWSCLQKRTEIKLQDLPVVLGACCVLHNICEMSNEEMDRSLKFDLVDDEMIPDVPVRSASSMKARDAIAHNLLHHGLAGNAYL